MKSTKRSNKRCGALRKLLDLCDDLQRLRGKLADPELRRETRTRLRRQALSKTDHLARDLASYRFRGPLGRVLREVDLSPVHFQVLATLLQHHLRSDLPGLTGRSILASIFENSFDALGGLELLHQQGALRASGLIILEDDEECADDVLEASFRVSEDALVTFQEEIAGIVVDDQRRESQTAYHSNRDYLTDLHILHNLYQHRSDRVFHPDRRDRIHTGAVAPGGYLTQRIASFSKRVQHRIEATPNLAEFPAANLFREHQLEAEEVIIVIHLLFAELYDGNAYADAVDLIRLVSVNEAGLIRNRKLVHSSGALVRHEIIHIEPTLEQRELTAEVHLNNWVVNHLFGAVSGDAAIDTDEQLDWHLYLRNLGDTHNFYRDLEAN